MKILIKDNEEKLKLLTKIQFNDLELLSPQFSDYNYEFIGYVIGKHEMQLLRDYEKEQSNNF